MELHTAGLTLGRLSTPRSGNVEYVENPALLLELLSSKTADAVVAFDVLEHADDFVGVATTLFSQSRRYVMISLPNEMSIHVRLSFLLGKGIPCHRLSMCRASEGDRHRWLIGYKLSLIHI